MEEYVIKGGRPLAGEVVINGAKNAALGIIAGAIMTEEPVLIENLPDVWDINVLLEAIAEIGAVVDRIDRHAVRIVGTVNTGVVDNDNMRKIRGSYYLLGALLNRFGTSTVPMPGGCNIGSRPIDQTTKAFKALGAKVDINYGMVTVSADKLKGSHIYFDIVSVGATINAIISSVLAEGQTIIENSAKEPHVVDVANFLNSMGANIKGAGTDVIRVMGVRKLHGTSYTIIPDQIEAGTFMLAAAATKGDVLIHNVIPKHLEAITAKLIEIGVEVTEYDDAVRVVATGRLGSTQVKTLTYPGFPTDMQPQMTALLALSDGVSTVTENIFENRLKYVDELSRMGASIKVEGNTAIIHGVSRLTGATMNTPDLRAGAALVIAALCAESFSIVEQVEFIERGYEQFEFKLRSLGAVMEKVDDKDTKAIKKFKLKVG